MASIDLHSIFALSLRLALVAAAALYAGRVLMTYLTTGPQLRPPFDLHDAAGSAERLAVWLGVKTLALSVRAASRILGMLSEASAEVGDWFLRSRHPEAD